MNCCNLQKFVALRQVPQDHHLQTGQYHVGYAQGLPSVPAGWWAPCRWSVDHKGQRAKEISRNRRKLMLIWTEEGTIWWFLRTCFFKIPRSPHKHACTSTLSQQNLLASTNPQWPCRVLDDRKIDDLEGFLMTVSQDGNQNVTERKPESHRTEAGIFRWPETSGAWMTRRWWCGRWCQLSAKLPKTWREAKGRWILMKRCFDNGVPWRFDNVTIWAAIDVKLRRWPKVFIVRMHTKFGDKTS